MAQTNVDVVPFGEPTPAVEQLFGLPVRAPAGGAGAVTPEITLRHRSPPAFMNPHTGYYVHIQPWEFGVAPLAWSRALARRADDVWCYTEHVRRAYLDAGLPAERLHVIPLGFDPSVYHPHVQPLPVSDPNRCIFLFVGGTAARKNVLGAVDAFLQAFGPNDEVALLVKTDSPAGALPRVSGAPA